MSKKHQPVKSPTKPNDGWVLPTSKLTQHIHVRLNEQYDRAVRRNDLRPIEA